VLQLRTTSGQGPVLFDASGVSYITGGNFGLNMTSPRSRLDVFETTTGNQTAIRIGNSNTPSSANDRRLEFVDGTGTSEGTNKYTYGYVQGYRQSGSNDGGLIFGTKNDNASAPTEKVRIASNGALSINHAAAGDKNLHIGVTSSGDGMILKAPGNHYVNIDLDSNRSGANNGIFNLMGKWNGTDVAAISFTTGTDTTNKDDGYIRMYTRESGQSLTERLQITTDGKIGINQTPTRELSLHSPNNNNALIHFTNDDTGETASDGILIGLNGNEDCIVNNQESGKNIIFYTHNGSSVGERLRIDNDGYLIKAAGRAAAFNVRGTNMPRNNADGYICTFDDDSSTGCFDSGGNFNTSSYKFIAPVDGIYYFFTNIRLDSYSTGYIRTAFLSTTHGTSSQYYNIPETGHVISYPTNSSGIMQVSTSTIMNLSKDDEVYVWQDPQNDTSYTVYLSESSFGGYLIG